MIRPTTHHLQSVLVEIPQLRLLLLSYALHYFEGHSTFVQGSSDTGYGYTLFKVVTNEINHFMAAHIGFFRKLMTEGHLHYRGDLRIGARAVRWDGRSSVSCIRRSCSADSANATRGRLRLSRYSLSLAGSSRGFGRASIWKVGGHSNGLVCLLVFLGMWRSGERRHDHSEPLFT